MTSIYSTNPQWITVTALLGTILPQTNLKGNLFLVATFKIKGSDECVCVCVCGRGGGGGGGEDSHQTKLFNNWPLTGFHTSIIEV